jgi:putative endonuclease
MTSEGAVIGVLCLSPCQPEARDTLYLGMTNDLVRRVHEHKSRSIPGFSAHYGVDRLVWFEAYDDPTEAISREKALKKWRRDWKIRLIEDQNPDWRDLYPALLR